MWYTAFMPAGMMELVDMRDLGSRAFSVGVRVPMPAPRRSKLYIACSDFLQKSERAHAAAPPFQITTASLGCDLVLGADWKAGASKVFVLSSSEIPCLARIPALRRGFLAGRACFSLPNRTHCVGLRFGFLVGCIFSARHTKEQGKTCVDNYI